jgi:hypothetical protein
MPRRHEPTAAETLDQLKTINKTIFRGMSPGTKTGLMAAAAFLVVFMIFAPKPTPQTQKYYTGCELSGAIKDCDAIMSEYMASSSFSTIGMNSLPLDRGAPSREDQVRASLTQRYAENEHRDRISGERLQAEEEARKLAREKQWGVKDHD